MNLPKPMYVFPIVFNQGKRNNGEGTEIPGNSGMFFLFLEPDRAYPFPLPASSLSFNFSICKLGSSTIMSPLEEESVFLQAGGARLSSQHN